MNPEHAAKAAMIALIDKGDDFKSRDLSVIAERHGVTPSRAFVLANTVTQDLKRVGVIDGGRDPKARGSAYVWRKVTPPPLTPVLKGPVVEGLYDPPAALEGANSGLTEAFAERLWHELGGGDRTRTLKENTSIMEAAGWRGAAERLLQFLFDKGMVGPAGVPNKLPGAEWAYAWVYEADNWEIVDKEGGGVALVLNDQDVPMMLAAPEMAVAIKSLLLRFEEKGGIKRSDIEALERSLPKTTGA